MRAAGGPVSGSGNVDRDAWAVRGVGLEMACLQFGPQVPDLSLPLSRVIQPNYLKFALPIAANSQKKTPTIARSRPQLFGEFCQSISTCSNLVIQFTGDASNQMRPDELGATTMLIDLVSSRSQLH